MLKIILTAFVLPLLLLFAPTDVQSGEKNPADTKNASGTLQKMAPTLTHGPDVIVGDLPDMAQFGSAGTQVGLGIAADACNYGDQPINWFALPNTDHPVVPQNLYRMSGDNTRFEQIGQSWMKHTFGADESNSCSLGCNTNNCNQGVQLCPGCSDLYLASTNADQNRIGSRAWINPFTGVFQPGANNHNGHSHDGASHRIRVNVDDLNTTLNAGATYFAEAQYITPHEYAWCQSHPGECNMYNNVSYHQYTVSGSPPNFTFSPFGSTVRMQPAIMAWTTAGATVTQYQPDPGNDGIFFVGYKVTGPNAGVWHYEYAIYNENLDRAIQSFKVFFPWPVNLTNIGFHAPPQEPGWANDGTFNNQGYSSTPWAVTPNPFYVIWAAETLAQNQNANAIRWGTLYNFRFDAQASPSPGVAAVEFFKTGSLVTVGVPVPNAGTPSPTPTSTVAPTSTPTATLTPRPTPTARPSPIARPRPTPAPRP